MPDRTPGVYRTDSDEIWRWLPRLGPTATVLAHLLARYLDNQPVDWDVDALTALVGLGGSCGRLWATLDRLASFRVVTFVADDVISVRCQLPALPVFAARQAQAASRPRDRSEFDSQRQGGGHSEYGADQDLVPN